MSDTLQYSKSWDWRRVLSCCREAAYSVNIWIWFKYFPMELHVLLYPNVIRCFHQNMHNITRDTAMVINIRCCLSDFQVARPHAVCCIKENTHLKVDFWEDSGGGGETEGCLLILKHLEGDVVALEARIVRQSSEATPQGWPRIVATEKTTGLACRVQMGQCDDHETFYSKLIQQHVICQQAFLSLPEYQSWHPAVERLFLKETWL